MKKYFSFVLIGCLLVSSGFSYSQDNTSYDPEPLGTYVTGGFGVLEVLNIGLTFEQKNSQFAFKIGTIPTEKILALYGDYCYHFARRSKKTGKKTLYAKAGINYYYESGKHFTDKMIFINTRIGQELYFTEKLGMEADIGIMWRIYYQEIRTQRSFFDFDLPIIPGASVTLFYKLQ